MFLATVRFRGFGHDGSGGVAVLDVRRGRAHHPRCRATRQEITSFKISFRLIIIRN